MAFGDDPERYIRNENGDIIGLTPYGEEVKKIEASYWDRGLFHPGGLDGARDEALFNLFLRDQLRPRSLLCWGVVAFLVWVFHILSQPAPAGPFILITLLLVGVATTSPTFRLLAFGCLGVLVLAAVALIWIAARMLPVGMPVHGHIKPHAAKPRDGH